MADDDIIELTDIVKAGHASAPAGPSSAGQAVEPTAAAQGAVQSAAPDMAQMPDFGADLDELLQNYDKPAAKASAAPATADDESMAAPIFNQEDADHKVDPNEELELPPLSDLDALLEELGVQDNSPVVDAPAPAFVGDDLDAVPSLGPEESAAPAEAVDDEGIDLNELDALLDSVLASAPRPAKAAAPDPEPAAAPAPKSAAAPVPKSAVAPAKEAAMPEANPVTEKPVLPGESEGEADVAALRAEVAALRAELDDLRANIDKYAAAAAAKVIREELAVIAASLE